jgi:hypothetical protein
MQNKKVKSILSIKYLIFIIVVMCVIFAFLATILLTVDYLFRDSIKTLNEILLQTMYLTLFTGGILTLVSLISCFYPSLPIPEEENTNEIASGDSEHAGDLSKD